MPFIDWPIHYFVGMCTMTETAECCSNQSLVKIHASSFYRFLQQWLAFDTMFSHYDLTTCIAVKILL